MLTSDSRDDTPIEVITYEARQFGDKLTLPLDGRHRFQARTLAMENAKDILTKMGLKINIDFKIGLDDVSWYPVVRFSPEHEECKTMLLLMWGKNHG